VETELETGAEELTLEGGALMEAGTLLEGAELTGMLLLPLGTLELPLGAALLTTEEGGTVDEGTTELSVGSSSS
jgi:hypothetical protein